MKKLSLKKRKQVEQPSRITNETVAEHREQILAGGRKFKYPRQYERHRLVFNVIIIILVTLVILAVVIWWQLYPVQNTSTFFYRVTRILPVPVASVDGSPVRYSDYLMSLSGSQHYLEQSERLNLNSDDGKRQIEFIKRQALDGAIADTYAAKIADQKGIKVTDKQVDAVIDASLNTVSGRISQDIYDDSTLSTLGYSADEYRQIIKRSLVRQEVTYSIDSKADKGYSVQLGSTGLVPKSNHDGGVTQEAAKLQKNQISSFFRSNDGNSERNGYYIVQLIDVNDKQVNYNYLRIPLTEFDKQIKSLSVNKKIQEYISVQKDANVLGR
jgi:hypothetical protein